MKNIRKMIVAGLCAVAFTGAAAADDSVPEVYLADSTVDGMVYTTSVADSAYTFDRADYAVFIPAGVTTVRGVFVHQHGCTMEGRGASTAYDVHYRAFAKKWDLALAGPDLYAAVGGCGRWRDPESGSGEALIRALERVGALSGHTELATAPWLLWGHSGGGYWVLAMMKCYPERIMATFAYSPAFDPEWDFPEAAHKIPLMIRHAGQDDLNGPRVACWQTALHVFDRLRRADGYVSIAYTPGQNHNFSYVRHMAIPFYEAVLAQRLPTDAAGGYKQMRGMNENVAWLGDTLTLDVRAARHYAGDASALCWLPDSLTAAAWKEFVSTGNVADRTPPPAPYALTATTTDSGAIRLTWRADADVESGLKRFHIYRGGRPVAVFPSEGVYQQFDTNGDDVMSAVVLPELQAVLPAGEGDGEEIVIYSVNHFDVMSAGAVFPKSRGK